jgi:hypothetical protein
MVSLGHAHPKNPVQAALPRLLWANVQRLPGQLTELRVDSFVGELLPDRLGHAEVDHHNELVAVVLCGGLDDL